MYLLIHASLCSENTQPFCVELHFQFFIPSFKDFVGDERDKKLPCPVWAIKQILSRMDKLRPQCNQLFISVGQQKKSVTKYLSAIILLLMRTVGPVVRAARVVKAKA